MAWLLALLLALPASAGLIKKENQSDALPPDKFVEQFLKVPLEELDAANIEDFLSIDPKVLPKRLQQGYKTRRLELYTLKHLAVTRGRGAIRTPQKDCAIPLEAKSDEPLPLKRAGYMEITEEEAQHVMHKTKCTERELMCETTFQVVVQDDPNRPKVKKRRYFLYPNDPLAPLVEGYRQAKDVGGNTPFFGQAGLLCSH